MNKEKLIRVSLSKKYILAFRIFMLTIAILSLAPIYVAFTKGTFVSHGMKFDIGSPVIYMYCFKYLLISALFIWLGTAGCKVKES